MTLDHRPTPSKLPGSCTLRDAAALKAALLPLVGLPGPVIVDAAGVERIDTAGLQVLAAFALDRRRAGLATEWVVPSAALSQAARLIGVADILGFDQAHR